LCSKITRTAVYALVFFSSLSVDASPVGLKIDLKSCALFLARLPYKTYGYVKEVKDSPYYSRLLIKEKKPSTNEPLEFEVDKRNPYGFFPKTDPKAGNFIYYMVPDPQIVMRWASKKVISESRDLKMGDGLKNVANKILKKGTQSERVKSSPVLSSILEYFSDPELSGPSAFLIDIMVAGGAGYLIYDAGYSAFENLWIDFNILTDPAWANTIRYDYRYFYLKQKIASHTVSNFGGVKEAHLLNVSYRNYYDYMIKKYPKDKDNFPQMKKNLRIISNEIKKDLPQKDQDLALFSSVFWFIDHGVQSTEAFAALNPGPLAIDQEEDLFEIYNILYVSYQSVSVWISKQRKTYDPFLEIILNQPHEKKLISYFKSGKLTDLQLLYFLGQDFYFEAYYKELDVLQIVPFRIHNKVITSEFNTDTLEDLQAQIDYNIENRINMP
jgi:hypothetical protein